MEGEPEAQELRVAVLCRGPVFRAWQADVLRQVLAVPGVVIPLLVVEPGRGDSGARARLRPDATWLWRLYNNRWVARRSSALRSVDLGPELGGAKQLVCRTVRRGRWSEHFRDDDIEQIREHRPDVLLRFAYGIIRGEILEVARHGVWSFHHGDIDRYRGGPPAFWEVVRGDDVSGAVLQRLTDRLDGGVVLRRGWFSTAKHSYVQNVDRVRTGSTAWPAQVCRDVLAGRTEALDAAPTPSTAPIDHNPTNGRMLRYWAQMAHIWPRHQVRSILFADRWRIGVIDRPINEVVEYPAVVEPRWLDGGMRRHEYLADPFPADAAGDEVLAERYSYRAGIGRLVTVDAGRRAGRTGPLEVPFAEHASYPFVVEGAVDPTCIPQITGLGGVRAFRLTDGVRRLGDERVLIEGVEARDPTVVHHDGRWWCFFTDGRRGAMSHLHVWWADALEGPWQPHEGNPVKVDVRSARPAGTPFLVDGVLHRPAQDCSRTYGGAIVVNRVVRLTPEAFEERPVATVAPSGSWSDAAGCHTLSAWGSRTLIDAHWQVVCLPAVRTELRARLRPRNR